MIDVKDLGIRKLNIMGENVLGREQTKNKKSYAKISGVFVSTVCIW